MASTQKTSLGFNKWVETDKPVMQDFNADNALAERLLRAQLIEKGNWTPRLQGATTAGTPIYSQQTGSYFKIGDLIYLQGTIVLTSKGGMSGYVQIVDYPFTANNAVHIGSVEARYLTLPTSAPVGLVVRFNGSILDFRVNHGNGYGTSVLQAADIENNAVLLFSIVYRTNQ